MAEKPNSAELLDQLPDHADEDAPPVDGGDTEPADASEDAQKERDRKAWREAQDRSREKGEDDEELDEDGLDEAEGPRAERPKPDQGQARRQLEVTARGVFRRAGMTDRIIDHMLDLPSDELRAELNKSIANVRGQQRESDRLGNELAEARRKPKPEDAPADKPKTATQKMLAAIQKRMADGTATQEDADLLPDLIEQAAAERRQPDQGRGDPKAPTEDDYLRDFRDPLDDLQANYPQLKAEDKRRELIRTADRLSRDGAFSDIRQDSPGAIPEILSRAAEVLFAAKDPRRAQRDRERANRIEREGQPTPERRASPGTRRFDEKSVDRVALKHLAAGRSPQWVSRWKQRQLERATG